MNFKDKYPFKNGLVKINMNYKDNYPQFNKYKNKFYWNEDTLDYFKFQSNYQSKDEVIKEITDFVENNCSLESNETEEDLIIDLTNQVYNK